MSGIFIRIKGVKIVDRRIVNKVRLYLKDHFPSVKLNPIKKSRNNSQDNIGSFVSKNRVNSNLFIISAGLVYAKNSHFRLIFNLAKQHDNVRYLYGASGGKVKMQLCLKTNGKGKKFWHSCH